jgi:hypothetical protein
MLKLFAVLTAVFILSGLATASDSPANEIDITSFEADPRSPEFLQSLGIEEPKAYAAQYGCCKICRQGKACGNTCISRDKACHVGPGCACDG